MTGKPRVEKLGLDYGDILDKILNSEFAKAWMKRRKADLKDEIEFYGKPLKPSEWKSNMLSDFFAESLSDIAQLLPSVWSHIKDVVRDELDLEVLRKPESLEDHMSGSSFSEYVQVPFSLSEYLDHLDDKLQDVLKKRLKGG